MRLVLSQLRLEQKSGLKNFDAVERMIRSVAPVLGSDDIVLLPELIGGNAASSDYESSVRDLARSLGCFVVGGSHYSLDSSSRVNRGVVVDHRGEMACRYEKIKPYGVEPESGVTKGSSVGSFTCGGRSVAVFICADFWHPEIVNSLDQRPDVFLISSFSVSRKSTPEHPRALWESLAISRAYEFGAFVGISDWAHPVEFAGLRM